MHVAEYYSDMKKEGPSFFLAATQMDLEAVTLSDTSHTQSNILQDSTSGRCLESSDPQRQEVGWQGLDRRWGFVSHGNCLSYFSPDTQN